MCVTIRAVVRLRLARLGKKKQPTYRIVAADARAPRDGAFLDVVGLYNPRTDPSTIRIDADKAIKWLRQGAQPSGTVERLLVIAGVRARLQELNAPPADAPPTAP